MQVALLDGTEIIAFDLTAADFENVRTAYRADPSRLQLPDGCPAVPKRGQQRMAHFAHRVRTGCTTREETVHHIIAKKMIRDTATAAGWNAKVEARSPTGSWQADVLVWRDSVRLAFEVQWSPQSPQEYAARSARYAADGITAVWIARSSMRGFTWHNITQAVHALPYRAVDPHDDPDPWAAGIIMDTSSRRYRLDAAIRETLNHFAPGVIPSHAPKLRKIGCYACEQAFIYRDHPPGKASEPFTDAQLEDLERQGTPGATLQRVYRHAERRAYLAWHCPHCRRLQGAFHSPGIPMTVAHGQLVKDTRHLHLWKIIQRRLAKLPAGEVCRFPDQERHRNHLDDGDEDDEMPYSSSPFAPPRVPMPKPPSVPPGSMTPTHGSATRYAQEARRIRLAIEQGRREQSTPD